MHVYKSVVEKFLPTPSKSHYVFNLRDFARVVFGVLLVPSTHLQEGDKLIRLWIHEVYRVFYDRLIDSNDRVMFFDMMKETTKQQFKKDMDSLLEHIVPTGQKLKDDHIRLYFVDTCRKGLNTLFYRHAQYKAQWPDGQYIGLRRLQGPVWVVVTYFSDGRRSLVLTRFESVGMSDLEPCESRFYLYLNFTRL